MEFTPFKPVPQVINFVEKPKNQEQAQIQQQQVLDRSQGKIKQFKTLAKNIGSKYGFIDKYRLSELRSELQTGTDTDNNANLTYYYDQKSGAVFEFSDSGPIVFMKSNKETTKHLLKLNNIRA